MLDSQYQHMTWYMITARHITCTDTHKKQTCVTKLKEVWTLL